MGPSGPGRVRRRQGAWEELRAGSAPRFGCSRRRTLTPPGVRHGAGPGRGAGRSAQWGWRAPARAVPLNGNREVCGAPTKLGPGGLSALSPAGALALPHFLLTAQKQQASLQCPDHILADDATPGLGRGWVGPSSHLSTRPGARGMELRREAGSALPGRCGLHFSKRSAVPAPTLQRECDTSRDISGS